MCLDPSRVGFSLNDLEVYTNLPTKTSAILKLLTQHLPAHLVTKLAATCHEKINVKKEYTWLVDYLEVIKANSTSSTAVSIDWLKLSQLINGFEQLSMFNLFTLDLDLNKIIFEYIARLDDNSSFQLDEQETESCSEAKRKLFSLSLNFSKSSGDDYLIQIIDKYLFSSGNAEAEKRMSRFFQFYKSELCQAICVRYETLVKYIVSKVNVAFVKAIALLVFLVEHVSTDKTLRKTHGSKLVTCVYDHWAVFKANGWQQEFAKSSNNSTENKLALINLLTKALLVESNRSNSSAAVSEMYMSLLVDKTLKLGVKIKLLDLLYFFADSPEPYTARAYLGQFIAQLPLKSSELVRGESSYNDYANAIRKLLVSLELSRSLDLFHVMVKIVCREREHIFDPEVQASFVRFVRHLEASKQASLLDFYWTNSFRKPYDQDDRKFTHFDKVIFEILKTCDKPVFLDFMSANVVYLIGLLESDLRDTRESQLEEVCRVRTCALRMLELAYKRLHKDEIFFSGAKLCMAYETTKLGQVKDGKELTKEVLRKCRKHLSEDLSMAKRSSSNMADVVRQLHCSAYNCLSSLFIRTQTEPKLYLVCLFKDDVNKREFIFEPLIDTAKKYKFPVETEKFEERKTKFISLRDEFRESSNDAGANGAVEYISSVSATGNGGGGVSYMNTQNMYESSLSEELSVFDFTAAGKAHHQQQHILSTSSLLNSSSSSLNLSGSFGSSQSTEAFKRKHSAYFYRYDEVGDENFKRDATIEIEIDDVRTFF
jgi:hypothetical protein